MTKREAANPASAILRRVRKAERQTGDGAELGGTGFTILKQQPSPIARLLDRHKIGPEELQAAEDIALAFHALAGALMLRPLSMERSDRSNSPTEPVRAIDATTRYKKWADIWTKRAVHGDPTLEIVIAAVVDERSFRDIDFDLNLRNGRSALALTAGLRDYAARAGWATGSASQRWLVGEGSIFRLRKIRPIETLRGMARRWDLVGSQSAI